MQWAQLWTAILLDPGLSSSISAPKGTCGQNIQRYRHVERNLRSGQEIVRLGSEVADIEHAVIATAAMVEHGKSVLRSPAGHWIIDGVLEPPTGTNTVALKKDGTRTR